MTLLNARLGAWLGNPGSAGNRTWRQSGPRTAIGSLVKEAFGLTTNTNEYVYLSDGGHFENLALYKMVLRRCRHIVVLDSGCDAQFTLRRPGQRTAQDPHRSEDPHRVRRRRHTPAAQ